MLVIDAGAVAPMNTGTISAGADWPAGRSLTPKQVVQVPSLMVSLAMQDHQFDCSAEGARPVGVRIKTEYRLSAIGPVPTLLTTTS